MKELTHEQQQQIGGGYCGALACQELRCEIAQYRVKLGIVTDTLSVDTAVDILMSQCAEFAMIGTEDTREYVLLLQTREQLRELYLTARAS